MKVTFIGLTTEYVKKPGSRTGYTKGTIDYEYNGEPRKQTIMSFSNPTVFKQVSELAPNTEIDIEVTKNAAGYNEWKSVNTDGSAGAQGATSGVSGAATPTKVVGSNYETREERANRQVLIVRQSSLSAAVATLAPGAKVALDPDAVVEVARQYEEYVFSVDEESAE